MTRRRFTDNAGYTCHCWECANATFMRGNSLGWCFIREMEVSKYDSPNNGCSKAAGCMMYESRAQN